MGNGGYSSIIIIILMQSNPWLIHYISYTNQA